MVWKDSGNEEIYDWEVKASALLWTILSHVNLGFQPSNGGYYANSIQIVCIYLYGSEI